MKKFKHIGNKRKNLHVIAAIDMYMKFHGLQTVEKFHALDVENSTLSRPHLQMRIYS